MMARAMRLAFLGPHGTFSEEAVLSDPELALGEHVPCRTIPDVVELVERGDADAGLIPLENSIEGVVTVTLDTLAFSSDLLIQREVDLPVSLHLVGLHGATVAGVRRVASHSNPLEQARLWLARELPAVDVLPVTSTSDAARAVAESGDPTFAAIGPRRAAELYDLEVLAAGIEDHDGNETRFILVGRGVPAPTGNDKTSVVCFQHDDHPGSLVEILQEFARRGINLTKLDSRPNKQGLGRYCFFIDFRGHIEDDGVTECLRVIGAAHAEVKFLGSYPAGPARNAPPRAHEIEVQA